MKLQVQIQKKGFTILEVMLATAIFALIVVSLAVLLNQGVLAHIYEKQNTRIRLMLESRMAELTQECRTQVLTPDNEWKKIETDDQGITYEKKILLKNFKNSKDKILPNIFSVNLRARWTQDNREQEQTVEIYLYKPQ